MINSSVVVAPISALVRRFCGFVLISVGLLV
jgi:hypothetical protein